MAFDNLFCVAFEMMDAQWLAKRASYMEFNVKFISTLLIALFSLSKLDYSVIPI